jgi:DNA-binding MarR family transcriptional regulator
MGDFFLDCLKNIQRLLMQKLKDKENREHIGIGMRELNVYTLVENNPGISSGDIAKRLDIPNSTVKRILTDLVSARNLVVHGAGRGTRYSIAVTDLIKRDVAIILTNTNELKNIRYRRQVHLSE